MEISKQARLTLLSYNKHIAILHELENNLEFIGEPIVSMGTNTMKVIDLNTLNNYYEVTMSYYYLMSKEEQLSLAYKWIPKQLREKIQRVKMLMTSENSIYYNV